MTHAPNEQDARAALLSIDEQRRLVIDEIDLPAWYWWGLAACWIGLGVLSDTVAPWVMTVVLLAFGTAHAAVAGRVLSGRHRTRSLSVRADLVDRHAGLLVTGALLCLVAVTVFGSVLIEADGARHPVTIASVCVAIAIVLGGPQLMAAIRRRSSRSMGLA
jgi:hypothetical protein